jgi:hypothetical protein
MVDAAMRRRNLAITTSSFAWAEAWNRPFVK